MAGLVPAIHDFQLTLLPKTWMPATSAGMTMVDQSLSPRGAAAVRGKDEETVMLRSALVSLGLRSLGLASLVAASVWVGWNAPATAQGDPRSVTCQGALTDVWLKPKDPWPLAIIYDRDHDYTCSYDRRNATHDPLKACVVGQTCRISGTYRKHEGYAGSNPTYSIQMLESVDRVDDEP
jgi:hypothetical protein